MKYKLIVIMLLFFAFLPCNAQSNNNSLFSLDLSYSLTSLLSHGWGIGINYERSLFDYFSLKGNFGHMTLTTGIDDVYCTSVHISLYAYYYPFVSSLDKLYIGAGSGCDFMNYFGEGNLPHTTQDTLIHITPQLGWKLNLHKFFMIDISIGYKFLISDTQNYKNIKDYVHTGLNFSLGFNILFNQMKKEKNKQMEIAATYVLLEDDQEICYGDSGLPCDFSRNYSGPERGAFISVSLSANASTMFVINEAGEMYTRLIDFDIIGKDPMFFKYTYIPYKSDLEGKDYLSNLNEWALPSEDCRLQPRIPLSGNAAGNSRLWLHLTHTLAWLPFENKRFI